MRSASLLLLAAVAVPTVAHADRRALTRTYEYMTSPEGQTEVELYTTQTRSTWATGAPEKFEFQLELEHGLTERWDVSLYHVFEQTSGDAATASPLQLSEVKLRSRYRFAERGEHPVDVVAYGEVVKHFGASAYVAEAKAIVARDVGLLTVAANAIGEVSFGADIAEPEVEVGWAAGASYELSPTWKFGAESWGKFEVEHPDQLKTSAGPAASWAPSARLWLTTTVGFGLNDRSDRFSVRAIIGLSL